MLRAHFGVRGDPILLPQGPTLAQATLMDAPVPSSARLGCPQVVGLCPLPTTIINFT